MLFNRRILVLPALVALSGQHAVAFTPATLCGSRTSAGSGSAVVASSVASAVHPVVLLPSRLFSTSLASSDVTSSVGSDVSIPYDAAARLAYGEWCAKFDRKPDESRYASFRSNYETIAVANVVAAKESQDAGTDRPKDLELNEYGDMTEDEYLAAMGGGGGGEVEEEAAAASPEKGPLETVMEASAAQSEASIALAEAADALAEEEEVSVAVDGSKPSLVFFAL